MDTTACLLMLACLDPAVELDHLRRFPGPAATVLALNRTQLRLMELRREQALLSPSRWQEMDDVIADALAREWIWDSARLAHDQGQLISTRLRWLREVRRRLSAEDWAAGRMPPCGPP